MERLLGILGTSLFVVLTGCATAERPRASTPTPPIPQPVPAPAETAKFNAAVELFVAHDRANDWTPETCAAVAKAFDGVARSGQALYNAALSYERCNDDRSAKAKLEAALALDPTLHHARAQLALYRYKEDSNADAAIASLQQAVNDAHFQNVPALVDLATVQMVRDGAHSGEGCSDDMSCAKLNLQRALALDDTFMPATNQLALYYLQVAKKRASHRKADIQQLAAASGGPRQHEVSLREQLELAALVCSQAIQKNPNYAPIHNTAGLIENELGHVNGAIAEFGTATKLDPKFFEAQMNYAALNLGLRGFSQAEQAYRHALETRPNNYDAHLGLAVALRGGITGSEPNYDQLLAAVQAELDAAKKSDPNRPDAYYNEGILTQEFKTKTNTDKAKTIATLEDARKSFEMFLTKAAGKSDYDGSVKSVRGEGGRLQEIDTAIGFLK